MLYYTSDFNWLFSYVESAINKKIIVSHFQKMLVWFLMWAKAEDITCYSLSFGGVGKCTVLKDQGKFNLGLLFPTVIFQVQKNESEGFPFNCPA